MSASSPRDRRLTAATQAAHWLLALQSAELSDVQKAAFLDWLRESPLHVSELLSACRLHRDLRLFDGWDRITAHDSRIADLIPLMRAVGAPQKPPSPRRMRTWPLTLAASLAVTIVAAALLMNRLGRSHWTTESGERREMTLNDGTVVDLAPSSGVLVRFQDNLRFVALQRGEALFHVAKDAARPFVVQAGGTQVRAVGTVFNVAQNPREVSVTVVEGRVAVAAKHVTASADAAELSIPVVADEQLVISATDHSTQLRQVRADLEVAWAAGQLVFDNESVADIVRRFNRYNKVQLRLASEILGQRRMGGMFKATDPESFVAVLQSVGNAAVDRSHEGVIIIGARDIDSAQQDAP